MIAANLPLALLGAVAYLARKRSIPAGVAQPELVALVESLRDQPPDTWAAYLQMRRLSAGTWGHLHAFRVAGPRATWPAGTNLYGILTLCGAHAVTWPEDAPALDRLDATTAADQCAVCAEERAAKEAADLAQLAQLQAERDGLVAWLGQQGLGSLEGAAISAALAEVEERIAARERLRLEADLAAVAGLLPQVVAVLERIGGNTDLAALAHHLSHRLRQTLEGQPEGKRVLDVLTFYADPKVYALDPDTAVQHGYAPDQPAIAQDRGQRARVVLAQRSAGEET